MIFEKINTVIVSRGRGQSVGGLGAKASEGREQQQQQKPKMVAMLVYLIELVNHQNSLKLRYI